jgi:protein-arginine kinase activator protein McsA
MLCEVCHQQKATVHLTQTFYKSAAVVHEPGTTEQHFCQGCADAFFAAVPGMRHIMRDLVCLSDSYRSKLYDLLESTHPEAFDNHDPEACRRGSKLTREFLREQFKKDGIEVNDEVFSMLLASFWSHGFYARSEKYRKKKG